MRRDQSAVLTVVLIGTLMSAVDTTIVLLALPTITTDLHATLILSIWTILIYLLVIAILTTQLGKLGDIFGRGRIFNLGFLVFIIGSGLSGLSPTIEYLVGFRVVQAVGAALMQANSSAIVADTFEAQVRGRAFGFTTLGWNIGGTLGIVLGGVITTFISWRFIFYINVPIGLIGLFLGLKYVKDNNRVPSRLDYGGIVILGTILALIAYGATDLTSNGPDLFNGILILLGILLIPVFVMYEKRVSSPVIDFKAFESKLLSYSLLASFLQALGYLSIVFLLIMYLQGIRGLSPLDSALLLVPGYVVASLLAPKMGHYADRFGFGRMATLGIALMSVAVFVYLTLTVSSSYLVVITASTISGLGGAMFWPANNGAIMSAARSGIYGSIGGLTRTLSNIGTLLSFVVTITVASLAVSRTVAFTVFLGLGNLQGGVSTKFLGGIHIALIISLLILITAGVLSSFRIRMGGNMATKKHGQENVSPEKVSNT